MANYKELYDWLTGLGFPESHEQFTDFIKTQEYRTALTSKNKKEAVAQVSDATLFVLDSNNNPNLKITFIDAFPVSLEGLDFDITQGAGDYFIGLAGFRYRTFKIESV